ncbi:MAG TPA: hypothetical protein VF278_25495 [Pirellulales bacterium]
MKPIARDTFPLAVAGGSPRQVLTMNGKPQPPRAAALSRDALPTGGRAASDAASLGEAILLCDDVLRTWLRREIAKHAGCGEPPMDVDDMLSRAHVRALIALRASGGEAGAQVVGLMKKILHDLICDEARRRRAVRHTAGVSLSLDRDSAAARLAELLIDQTLGADEATEREEFLSKLRAAIRRLPSDELRVVRLRMRGCTWQEIEHDYVRGARGFWSSALTRLRRALDADATEYERRHPPAKPR